MLIVTGGAGFIGSALVWKLNSEGINNIIIVDRLGTTDKWKNLVNGYFVDYFHKDDFLEMIREDRIPFNVKGVVHMGACSSTTERDADYLMENNYRYSRVLAEWAMKKGIRFVYASSAATYGDGSAGFSDDDRATQSLRPINIYGYSKQLFDLWVLRNRFHHKIAGVKFFNVFGPNEYHKGDMKSVVYKAYHQITETGRVGLFKSYKPEYNDGEQMRDFVYIKDCVEVLWWLLGKREVNGIFNLGTGHARTWNDLVTAVFSAMGRDPQIDYIEVPQTIRGQYQYFTEAKMEKLCATGCSVSFQLLEEAVHDYVVHYLEKNNQSL